MNSEDQRLFDLSAKVVQILSVGFRSAAGEASASLERQRLIAGCGTVEEYLFYPAHTWTKLPPSPTIAEVRNAFFELSGWTPGSKKNKRDDLR